MKNATLFVLVLAIVMASPAFARKVAGISIPETTTIEGAVLKLNGAGVRTKFIFRVYVAAFYAQSTSSDAGELLKSEQIKVVELHMKRDVDREEMVHAIKKGFAQNNKARMSLFEERLDRLMRMIPESLKEEDTLTVVYVPGKGISIRSKASKTVGVVEGKDFADAVFSVWLGMEPVDDDLKDELLGRE